MNATATEAKFVQVPAGLLPALRRAVAGGREPVEAVTILRQVGYDTGEAVHAAVLDRAAQSRPGLPADALTADDFWDAASAYFRDAGWGGLAHEQLHPGVGALDLHDWVEASGDGSDGVPPGCHLSTGIFADVLGRLAGGEVAVMEVQAQPGSSRLLFGSHEVLGAVYQGMVDGLSYADAVARLG
jgi:hypothetical protein